MGDIVWFADSYEIWAFEKMVNCEREVAKAVWAWRWHDVLNDEVSVSDARVAYSKASQCNFLASGLLFLTFSSFFWKIWTYFWCSRISRWMSLQYVSFHSVDLQNWCINRLSITLAFVGLRNDVTDSVSQILALWLDLDTETKRFMFWSSRKCGW